MREVVVVDTEGSASTEELLLTIESVNGSAKGRERIESWASPRLVRAYERVFGEEGMEGSLSDCMAWIVQLVSWTQTADVGERE